MFREGRRKIIRTRFSGKGLLGIIPFFGRGPAETPPWLENPTSLFDRLEKYWYYGPGEVNSSRPRCATPDEIAAFEIEHSVKFPDDFREYLLRFNGTHCNGDAQMLAFWQLDRLEQMSPQKSNLPEAERHFIFADYMISCWEYAIYLGDTPELQNRIVLYGYPGQPVVAQTFSAFIDLYLQNPKLVYAH